MTYIAYLATLCSIIGTVANSFQKRWCFVVWICTNIFWCVFNIANDSYAQALLYGFNFAMAVIGLIKWKQKSPSQTLNSLSTKAKKHKEFGGDRK